MPNQATSKQEYRRNSNDHQIHSVRPLPKVHLSEHPSIHLPAWPAHQQTNDHQRHSFQPKRRNLIDPTNPRSHLTKALWSASNRTVAPYIPITAVLRKTQQVGPRACSCRALLACDFPLWAYASNRRKATLRFSLSSWILWCDFLQLLCFLPSRFRYRSWIWIDLCFAVFVH